MHPAMRQGSPFYLLVSGIVATANLGVMTFPGSLFCTGTVKTDSYMACLLTARLGLNLRGLNIAILKPFLVALALNETKANQG